VGYGVNGLFMVSIGVLTVLVVSRWIIESRGLGANGIFSVAWKVASVYLGALYASASSYYFPSLVACSDDAQLRARVNEAISLYFYLLPPVVIALMTAGEDLMPLLFSREFAAAAGLLLFLLPGDLFRVLAEAMGMAFLARGKLLPYTSTYVLWAICFLALSALALPAYALTGVAVAYLAAQVVSAVAVYLCARRSFAFAFDRATLRGMGIGMLTVATSSAALLRAPAPAWRYAIGATILALWLAAACTDPRFRELAAATWSKLARIRGAAPWRR